MQQLRGGMFRAAVPLLLLASAASVRNKRSSSFLGLDKDVQEEEAHVQLSALSTEASVIVNSLLAGKSFGKLNLTAHIDTMRLEDAADAVLKVKNPPQKIPDFLARVLQQMKSDKSGEFTLSWGKNGAPPSEEMLNRAREILNGLIEQAQVELDTETIKCKEFHDSNREMHGQAIADINRISGVIGNLARMMGAAEASIQEAIAAMQVIDEEILKVQKAYDAERLVDETMMQSRQADLAAGTFIMRLTACPKKAASLVKLGTSEKDSRADENELAASMGVDLCQNGTDGGIVSSFQNPLLAAAAKNMSAEGFAILQEKLLNAGVSALPTAALQHSSTTSLSGSASDGMSDAEFVRSLKAALKGEDTADHEVEDQDEDEEDKQVPGKGKKGKGEKGVPPTTTTMPPTAQPPTPVSSKPDNPAKQANKCTLGKPNCGLLNDGMSLMWGEMKDAVDWLQSEMTRKENEHKQMLDNMNEEKKAVASGMAMSQEELGEASSSKGVEVAAQAEKQKEADDLQKEFNRVWGECKFTMNEILFTKICGTKRVRGTVLKHSKVVTPDKVIDCEVGDWIPGQCSVPCDDKLVGGMENLTREVVQNRNEFGIQCPILTLPKRCGMFPCPVHCKMSRWSGWSKCTKECEGGTQTRSRSVAVKPKNGGEPCEGTSDSRPCNTGSCDRDCSLKKWTKKTPCSQACGGGFQEQFRRVKVPIRAAGTCPAKKGPKRYKKSQCNTHPCVGDEVCVAKYDLVLAIDGSGSLRKKGFDVIKDFAAGLVKRFEAQHEEEGLNDKGKPVMKLKKAMKVGVVQFGNGRIRPDGSIQGAKLVQGLTSNLDKVEKQLKGMKWLRGFTNMAQAFTKSKDALMNGGRKNAQSVVMVISDGQPSFNFQTEQELNKLRDNNVRVVMVPIKAYPGKMLKKMKKWASVPWKTNLVYIKGLKKLRRNMEEEVARTLVHSCSKAISPSQMAAAEAAAKEAAAMEKMAKKGK